MEKNKEVTMYDIARKLNISTGTVSRGLQDHPAISKKTKKRILETVREMGYRANHFASNLRQQNTKTIGVIVHELNSSFITSVLAGIEKITAESGYDLIIAHSGESAVKEAANAKNLFYKRVDGLIASLSSDTKDLEHYRPFTEKGIPLIFFDRVEQDGNSTVVVIDNAKCGYIATQHLVDEGCRHIAIITSNLKRNVYAQRFKGYQDALFDNKIRFDEDMLVVAGLTEADSIAAAKQILAMRPIPDGVFITNDFVAAVCMRVFRLHGLTVPDDIAIVGFNNDAISNLVDPALTTINYPGIDMGEIAARSLINHLKGISDIHQTNMIVVRSGLIVRSSSVKRKGSK